MVEGPLTGLLLVYLSAIRARRFIHDRNSRRARGRIFASNYGFINSVPRIFAILIRISVVSENLIAPMTSASLFRYSIILALCLSHSIAMYTQVEREVLLPMIYRFLLKYEFRGKFPSKSHRISCGKRNGGNNFPISPRYHIPRNDNDIFEGGFIPPWLRAFDHSLLRHERREAVSKKS